MLAVHIVSCSDFFVFLFIGAMCSIYLLRKVAKNNPEVTDAAKKAASSKAIDLIRKWIK